MGMRNSLTSQCVACSTGYGNAGQSIMTGPGQFNTDFSLGKILRVGGLREDAVLAFRMEFYNLTNRVTFDVPARTVLSTTPMGRITSTRNVNGYVNSGRSGGARSGQLAIRFIF